MKNFIILIKLIFYKNGYLYNIYNAHFIIADKITTALLKRSNPLINVLILNLWTFPKSNFHFDKISKLYFISEENLIHYFHDASRGKWLYKYGLKNRAISLAKSYGIDRIDFEPGDIVVDVGANYGDVSLFFKLNNIHITLVAFEPDPNAYEALLKNLNSTNTFQKALSDFNGEASLFLASARGDSSLCSIEKDSKSIKTRVARLDEELKNVTKVKLLKVEAEGFEPEVISGAKNIINKIEFITVDGSCERGLEKASTIEEITNVLIQSNFEMVWFNQEHLAGKALFRNKAYQNKPNESNRNNSIG